MDQELLDLQTVRGSKIVVYATTDRQNLPMQIEEDVLSIFHDLLEGIGDQEQIDLFIYSRGGMTIVPLPLVRLVRKYCKRFGAIVPFRAHSAATMICIGADELYMTRKAELSPVDPQLTTNTKDGQRQYASTDLFAYMEYAKAELGWGSGTDISGESKTKSANEILGFLHQYSLLPPDYIGKIYRMYSQSEKYIQELAATHSQGYELSATVIPGLAKDLMRGFGSHDYKIDSEEAKKKLNLNVLPYSKPTEDAVNALYAKLASQLKLNIPFDVQPGKTGTEPLGILKTEKAEKVKSLKYTVKADKEGNPRLQGEITPWK